MFDGVLAALRGASLLEYNITRCNTAQRSPTFLYIERLSVWDVIFRRGSDKRSCISTVHAQMPSVSHSCTASQSGNLHMLLQKLRRRESGKCSHLKLIYTARISRCHCSSHELHRTATFEGPTSLASSTRAYLSRTSINPISLFFRHFLT